jgi:hypothetical protein
MAATQRLLDQAHQAIDAGDPQTAHELTRTILADEPDNHRATYLAAQAAAMIDAGARHHQQQHTPPHAPVTPLPVPSPADTHKTRVAGWMVLGGWIAVMLGALLTWATMRSNPSDGTLADIGSSSTYTFVIAIPALIAGIGLIRTWDIPRLGNVAAGCAMVIAILGGIDLWHLLRGDTTAAKLAGVVAVLNGTAPAPLGAPTTVGAGLCMTLVGAVVMYIGALRVPNDRQ